MATEVAVACVDDDADTEQLLRQRMKERGISFKQALNEAVREGLAGRRPPRQFRTRTAQMGRPTVRLDRALQLAGDLEGLTCSPVR